MYNSYRSHVRPMGFQNMEVGSYILTRTMVNLDQYGRNETEAEQFTGLFRLPSVLPLN